MCHHGSARAGKFSQHQNRLTALPVAVRIRHDVMTRINLLMIMMKLCLYVFNEWLIEFYIRSKIEKNIKKKLIKRRKKG